MNKSVNVFLRSVAHQGAIWGVCFFCYCNLALAGSVTFQRDYTYEAGEADSKLSCRAIALEQVKRLLLEELGTYLESETEIRNMQLAKDQITILTAGIVRVQVADEKWDGRTYYLRAKITADPKEVYNSIDKLRQDRQQIQEMRVIREEADKALSIVEILKKALRVSDDEYKKAVAKLRATQWVEKGRDLVLSGKAQEAIEALAEAIVLNPNWAESYLWRGRAYAALDERYDAIRDYNKAIELDPKSAESHLSRANAYNSLKRHQEAFKDYDKAIKLEPNEGVYHAFRGMAYADFGVYEWAIKDYNRAIELEPKGKRKANYYTIRGMAYARLKKYEQAIQDYDKAIELWPNDAMVHKDRALAYVVLGKCQQAIRSYDRAIELEPKNGEFYRARGAAYGCLGKEKEELEDFKKAARLGDWLAQGVLKRQGIEY